MKPIASANENFRSPFTDQLLYKVAIVKDPPEDAPVMNGDFAQKFLVSVSAERQRVHAEFPLRIQRKQIANDLSGLAHASARSTIGQEHHHGNHRLRFVQTKQIHGHLQSLVDVRSWNFWQAQVKNGELCRICTTSYQLLTT